MRFPDLSLGEVPCSCAIPRRVRVRFTLGIVQLVSVSHLSFLPRRPARCNTFMRGGSSCTRSLSRGPLWIGTWLVSALGPALWLSVHTCALAHSSLSIRRSQSCVPSCKSVCRWLGARKALPSQSNLPLRTPFFKLAGALTSCSKCPGSGIKQRWRNSLSCCDSRRPSAHPLLRPSLQMTTPRAASSAAQLICHTSGRARGTGSPPLAIWRSAHTGQSPSGPLRGSGVPFLAVWNSCGNTGRDSGRAICSASPGLGCQRASPAGLHDWWRQLIGCPRPVAGRPLAAVLPCLGCPLAAPAVTTRRQPLGCQRTPAARRQPSGCPRAGAVALCASCRLKALSVC